MVIFLMLGLFFSCVSIVASSVRKAAVTRCSYRVLFFLITAPIMIDSWLGMSSGTGTPWAGFGRVGSPPVPL